MFIPFAPEMPLSAPTLGQVNLIVQDVARSADFYRRLRLDVQAASRPDWARHHATALLPNGTRLELDSREFARQWAFEVAPPSGGAPFVLFIATPSRQDVDRLYALSTKAGARAKRAPQDAFWGARYAIVEDPDGNAVGLMSPIDEARRTEPPPPP